MLEGCVVGAAAPLVAQRTLVHLKDLQQSTRSKLRERFDLVIIELYACQTHSPRVSKETNLQLSLDANAKDTLAWPYLAKRALGDSAVLTQNPEVSVSHF